GGRRKGTNTDQPGGVSVAGAGQGSAQSNPKVLHRLCGIGKLITEGGCRACAYDIQHAVVIADRPRIVGGVKRLSFGVYTAVHLLRRAVIIKRRVVHRDKARFWSGE